MRSNINRNLIFATIIAFVIIYGIGFWVGKQSVTCEICPPTDVDFSLFWEAWQKIKKDYIDFEKIDVQKMVYGAISGMIKSLEDPYTVFFEPEETKIFIEDTSGRFEGVGMEIGIREEQLKVIAPLEGTPAQKAGLRAGDKILKIDDVSTIDITTEEAVSLIRGPKGTEVILTILREEWEASKEIKIKRAVIEVPSLKLEIKDDIAIITLYHFPEKIDYEFTKVANEILKSSAKKIILDLRNNPGGYLQKAQEIAGWFLEKGEIVVIEEYGEKKERIPHRAQGNAKLLDYPLIILINQGSASASEILASAIRDNRDIKIIGETSFGKGSVQKLEALKDGSSLKITIAHWLTPKGQLITGFGLEPDIKIEITEEDYQEERDPQLDKAIELFQNF